MTTPPMPPIRSHDAAAPLVLPQDLAQCVAAALAEDVGSGDRTAALVPAERSGRATVITREAATVSGRPYVDEVFRQVDPRVAVEWQVADGDRVQPNQLLYRLSGPARSLLTGERTALNFLQVLSATATITSRYADALAGLPCRVLDTRKTLPGLRNAQKYAVRCGGGVNHRHGLYDGILVKENHIVAAGSIGAAVAAAKTSGAGVLIEVEVETLDELRQALAAGADMALLDEFSLDQLRQAVALNRAHRSGPIRLEASGGVTLETIRAVAETGVDFISVGALTKNVRAIDLSMRFEYAG
ncbi:MAG TPA: carboxylating nicotinate-nucleotide diphosphorylase [Steroidobacteraceae bacterium]|nr:carboxylating nicotinate-nucleotide diphosphorylase [Steroidobacteraceae bacterium]